MCMPCAFTRVGTECVCLVDLPEWRLNVYVLLIYQSGGLNVFAMLIYQSGD